MRFLILVPVLMLGACAPAPGVTPSDIRLPDARLMALPKPLAPISDEAKGNSIMVESYAQCRLAHADEADRRLGLIAHVKAQRNVR